MGFSKLIDKVTQAEHALEAHERYVGAEWRQLKSSWRDAWTPGRIVVAGLLSGFMVGRARPLARTTRTGGGFLQLLGALSGLMASGSAQAAAGEAGEAADQAEATAEAVGALPTSANRQPAGAYRAPPAQRPDPLLDHEALRRQGLL